MSGTVPFSQLSGAWKQDAAFRAEYERIGEMMELAFTLAARREVALTQAEVARRMETSRAAIARLESGRVKPTSETVERYARGLGKRAVVELEPAEAAAQGAPANAPKSL